MILVEKEWVAFGHQFALRNGISTKDTNEDQRAPIFLQWLDCLHQLLNQFPSAFEFNQDFIVYIAVHYNSNLYGTFLFNNEKDRSDKNAREKTISIWTDIYDTVGQYMNPFYSENLGYVILKPNCSLFKIRFWEEYFMKNVHIHKQNLHSDKSSL